MQDVSLPFYEEVVDGEEGSGVVGLGLEQESPPCRQQCLRTPSLSLLAEEQLRLKWRGLSLSTCVTALWALMESMDTLQPPSASALSMDEPSLKVHTTSALSRRCSS